MEYNNFRNLYILSDDDDETMGLPTTSLRYLTGAHRKKRSFNFMDKSITPNPKKVVKDEDYKDVICFDDNKSMLKNLTSVKQEPINFVEEDETQLLDFSNQVIHSKIECKEDINDDVVIVSDDESAISLKDSIISTKENFIIKRDIEGHTNIEKLQYCSETNSTDFVGYYNEEKKKWIGYVKNSTNIQQHEWLHFWSNKKKKEINDRKFNKSHSLPNNRHVMATNNISYIHNIENNNNNNTEQLIRKIAITHVNHPGHILSKRKIKEVMESLKDKLNKMNNINLNFISCAIRNGWISITCNNQESYNWLNRAFHTIEPYHNKQLKICVGDDMPMTYICIIYIPPSDVLPINVLLHRLSTQNVGLNTTEWRVFKVSKQSDGCEVILFSIDELSKKRIERLGGKLFLNFNKIKVKVKTNEKRRNVETKYQRQGSIITSTPYQNSNNIKLSSN